MMSYPSVLYVFSFSHSMNVVLNEMSEGTDEEIKTNQGLMKMNEENQ